MMTQLIIEDVVLPRTSKDKYRSYPDIGGEQIEMISRRMVTEVRGTVQIIQYSYDCLGDYLWRKLSPILRSGKTFRVKYLPDDGDDLVSSVFLCTSLTPPSFGVERDGRALWHNIAFTLREERPHA